MSRPQFREEEKVTTMWNQESERNIMLVGHRGIRALYPENTILSFRKAVEMRFDLIEFDVHFTRDKVLVVCHDATIDRTTNRRGAIRDMTLEELRQVDAGVRKGAELALSAHPDAARSAHADGLRAVRGAA